MPDVDFATLLRDLETSVRQPEFATLRARSGRRRVRTTIFRTGAVMIAAAIAAIGGWALNAAPGGDTTAPAPRTVERFAVPDSGDMFFMLRGVCAATCAPGTVDSLSFEQSYTEEPAWMPLATHLLPTGAVAMDSIGPLVDDDAQHAYYAVGGTIYSTEDNGKTWHGSVVDHDPGARPGPASAFGAMALMTVGDRLYYVRAGTPPKPLPLPTGASEVSTLSYYSADDDVIDNYFVGMLASVDGRPRVFEHLGRVWIQDPTDPCPGGAVVSLATINSNDGGSQIGPPQYVVCSGKGGTATFRTSDDNGATWTKPVHLAEPATSWTAAIDGESEHNGKDAAVFGSTHGRIVLTLDASKVIDVTPPDARGHTFAAFGSANGTAVFQDVNTDLVYVIVVDNRGRSTVHTLRP